MTARQSVWQPALLVVAFNVMLLIAFAIDEIPFVSDTGGEIQFLRTVVGLELLGGIGLLVSAKTRSCGLALVCGLLISVALSALLFGFCVYVFRDL